MVPPGMAQTPSPTERFLRNGKARHPSEDQDVRPMEHPWTFSFTAMPTSVWEESPGRSRQTFGTETRHLCLVCQQELSGGLYPLIYIYIAH